MNFRCSVDKWRILCWLSNMEDTWHNTKHTADNTTTKARFHFQQLLYEHTVTADMRWSSCNLFSPRVSTHQWPVCLYQGLWPACCSFPSGSLPGWAGQIRRQMLDWTADWGFRKIFVFFFICANQWYTGEVGIFLISKSVKTHFC